jgi:hypothetical protein
MANGTAPTYHLRRCRLADGERTTLYVVRHALEAVRPRVHVFPQPRRLDHWCWRSGVREAIVGGFYLRDPFRPLGEVRVGGEAVPGTAFPAEHHPRRPAFHAVDGRVAIAPRGRLAEYPGGDLLQAGPLLVDDARVVYDDRADDEGFSAGAGQFDSDITEGRHPRAAIGVDDHHVWLLACDGRRSGVDAGLGMRELAELMAELGCRVAMNLDGGGSTTLVHHGHLLNRPYSEQDQPAPASRPIVTAVVLEAR